jgi:nucleoid-associated protein YgaU
MPKSIEMHRKILFSMVLAFSLPVVWAADVQLNPAHPQSYTVVKGDTLWDIAGRFLTKPWQWPQVWQGNPQIKNPNLIYPGDEITLIDVDGTPMLALRRGASSGRNVKLTPTVRESVHEHAIPPIPLDAINQFLSRPLVLSKAQTDLAPYVVGGQDQHLTMGAGSKIYLRSLTAQLGEKYTVLRLGGAYKDPASGEILGYEALHIADLSITAVGETSTGLVTWNNREVLKGDRVMPQENEEYPEFVPRGPDAAVDGVIISVIDGVSQIGQHKVVVVNKGAQDGLAPGHVLGIFQAGARVTDAIGTEVAYFQRKQALEAATEANPSFVGRMFDRATDGLRHGKLKVDQALGERIGGEPHEINLPEERAGEVMIFRTFDRVSYGLVMNTQRAVHIEDKVRNP